MWTSLGSVREKVKTVERTVRWIMVDMAGCIIDAAILR